MKRINIQAQIEELKRITKNAKSEEEAKQLIKLYLREQKRKIPDDMKY